jgi:hypothetical protein
MTTTWVGRLVRAAVCLVATRGRGPMACVLCPRESRHQARPSCSHRGGRQGLSLAACRGDYHT